MVSVKRETDEREELMKITKNLRELNSNQLGERLQEFKKELLKLNVQANSGANTSNPGQLKQTKKNIARIRTLLQEKVLSAGKGNVAKSSKTVNKEERTN